MVLLGTKSNRLGYMQSFSFIDGTKDYNILPIKVKRKYSSQYYFINSKNFVRNILQQIKNRPYFRIHLLGYFMNQPYLNKWIEITKKKPYITFYAYLRRQEEFLLDYSDRPKNFKVITVDQKTEWADNYAYTFGTSDTRCPRIHCMMCMQCLTEKGIIINEYPFI